MIYRSQFSSRIWLFQALGFLLAHLKESVLGRSLLWVTLRTIFLGGSVPVADQIINSGLYFFLRRTLICL